LKTVSSIIFNALKIINKALHNPTSTSGGVGEIVLLQGSFYELGIQMAKNNR